MSILNPSHKNKNLSKGFILFILVIGFIAYNVGGEARFYMGDFFGREYIEIYQGNKKVENITLYMPDINETVGFFYTIKNIYDDDMMVKFDIINIDNSTLNIYPMNFTIAFQSYEYVSISLKNLNNRNIGEAILIIVRSVI